MSGIKTVTGRLQLPEGEIEFVRHTQTSAGDESSPRTTLVLLHEGLGAASMWRAFPLDIATSTQCDVFAYSRFGYGNSDPCALPRSIDYMHEEAIRILPQILSQLHTSCIVLIGHSDGASIAAIHAGTYPDSRLAGVVMMAPHFFTEPMALDAIRNAKKEFNQGNLRSKLQIYHGTNVDCAFCGWNDAWLNPEFQQWDIQEFLPKILCPVLVIQGEQDQYGSAAQPECMQARAGEGASVDIVMLADCGHTPFRDQPATTIDLVTGFVLHTIGDSGENISI